MKNSLFIMVVPFFLVLASCNEIEFEQEFGNDAEQSSVDSNGFDENGNYIDNKEPGIDIITLGGEIDPSDIGGQGESVAGTLTCVEYSGSKACYHNDISEVFVGDSFERDDIISKENNIFSWRTIINDNGTIVDGSKGKNVELGSYDNTVLGEASNGDRSLYFTGRAGGKSIHSLYLVTRAFNLSETNGIVFFSFDYLPIGLEEDEYFKLEVCNDTVEKCGVGKDLTVEGLQSRNWKTIFHSDGSETRAGLNGLNHLKTDWINKQIAVRLDGFQRENFVFRLNGRMNEGFVKNDHKKGVEDAIGIDNFKAFTFLVKD